MNTIYYEDYLGFQFNGVHSRDLGLYRVVNSNRYSDISTPAFTDTTQKIPGGDGTYYWDSFFTQRNISISVAFDELDEIKMRKIRNVFNGKSEGFLIFDEMPYKKYRVKLRETPKFEYVPFCNESGARVLKGEGTLEFIAYSVYAIDNFKLIDASVMSTYPKYAEWSSSIGYLSTDSALGAISSSSPTYYVYNPGDKATTCELTIHLNSAPSSNIIISLRSHEDSSIEYGKMALSSNIALASGDSAICIDMARNLIYGKDSSGNNTSNLYNQYIIGGDFFTIPIDAAKPTDELDRSNYNYIQISSVTNPFVQGNTDCAYNYLFY